jgi:hypothetical protein
LSTKLKIQREQISYRLAFYQVQLVAAGIVMLK